MNHHHLNRITTITATTHHHHHHNTTTQHKTTSKNSKNNGHTVTQKGVCHQIKQNLKLHGHQCEQPQPPRSLRRQMIQEFVEGRLIVNERDSVTPAAAGIGPHITPSTPHIVTTTNLLVTAYTLRTTHQHHRLTSITLHLPPLSPPNRHKNLSASSFTETTRNPLITTIPSPPTIMKQHRWRRAGRSANNPMEEVKILDEGLSTIETHISGHTKSKTINLETNRNFLENGSGPEQKQRAT